MCWWHWRKFGERPVNGFHCVNRRFIGHPSHKTPLFAAREPSQTSHLFQALDLRSRHFLGAVPLQLSGGCGLINGLKLSRKPFVASDTLSVPGSKTNARAYCSGGLSPVLIM